MPSRTPAPATAAHVMPGGCAGTSVLAGAPPSWNPQPAGFTGPPYPPYVVGRGDAVMGYLWVRPLYAPESRVRSNKILWFMRYPRNGQPLRLSGHLQADPRRTVSATFPADSSPGEIYPSDVTVPAAGCWSFTLRWGSHVDRLSLRFVALPHGA